MSYVCSLPATSTHMLTACSTWTAWTDLDKLGQSGQGQSGADWDISGRLDRAGPGVVNWAWRGGE